LYPHMGSEAQVVRNPRDDIWGFVQKSNDLVEQLYILDKQEPFAASTKSSAHKRFATERLAAGATMLRDLWWTAWVTSGDAPAQNAR
ncbi:MAG: hypothetical protein ACK559_40395, partial [bacterium]